VPFGRATSEKIFRVRIVVRLSHWKQEKSELRGTDEIRDGQANPSVPSFVMEGGASPIYKIDQDQRETLCQIRAARRFLQLGFLRFPGRSALAFRERDLLFLIFLYHQFSLSSLASRPSARPACC
jgi:hypothetical protein